MATAARQHTGSTPTVKKARRLHSTDTGPQDFDRRQAMLRLIELWEGHPFPSMSDARLSRLVVALETVLLDDE